MNNITSNTAISENAADLEPQNAVSKPKNALVHGVYASEIILPWESEEDFETLHTELKAEWAPEGRTEEETILALARLHWLKHRLMRSTQMAFRKDPFVAELDKSGAKNWADVESFLQSKAKSEDSLMDEVRKTLAELKTATQKASSMMTASNPDTSKIYDQVQFFTEMFQKNVLPVYGEVYEKAYGKDRVKGTRTADNPSKTAIEEAYHPDYLEKIVRLESSIDARIDKTLSRIVNLKDYKRLAKPASKQIASQSIVPA